DRVGRRGAAAAAVRRACAPRGGRDDRRGDRAVRRSAQLAAGGPGGGRRGPRCPDSALRRGGRPRRAAPLARGVAARRGRVLGAAVEGRRGADLLRRPGPGRRGPPVGDDAGGGCRHPRGAGLRGRVLRLLARVRLLLRSPRAARGAAAAGPAPPRPGRVGGGRRRLHRGLPDRLTGRLAAARSDRDPVVGPDRDRARRAVARDAGALRRGVGRRRGAASDPGRAV
ncbi:MAG: Allophanate hydrolase 2 subunit 1, partial [uncultured Nocardioidaceae bacterium]